MPPRKFGNTLTLYKGPDNITLDLPLRHYKYLNSVEMNLAIHPLHPNLKKKLLLSMERAKILRKLKIDDDTESESIQIYEPYHKIVLRHCQSLSVLSNYVMNVEEITQSSSKIRGLLLKLKSLTKYKSFSLSPRELALAQRSLKALDLISSKFSNDDFKKTIAYLLTHKSCFPLLKELFLTCRLSRDRENILHILPTILRNPKFKQIRLGLLYIRDLPYYNTLPLASRAKVKELVMLMDDGHCATDILPSVFPFYNLETLSIGSPFRGFTVDIDDQKNWKMLEKLHNLKKFSLEVSLDSKNAKNLALLLSSLCLTKGLENLRLWFRFVPFEGLVDLYYGHLERFMRNIGNLHNLSTLSLMFESEKLRRLQEVTELLSRALSQHQKLKDVYIAFPEPRYRSHAARNHGVLDISKILCGLKNSQKSLEKLYIGAVKAEIKELREWVRFENLKKVTIAADERMNENTRLDSLLVAMEEESLRKLELKMPTSITLDDLGTLRDFKKLETIRISLLGENIVQSVQVLREIFVQSETLKEVGLEFPELDFREENRIEEMVLALLNKKRVKRINVKTKFMKYSFDRNMDGSMREQSSNEHRKIRFMY